MEAIIFIGHGSRSKQGNEQFKAFMENVFENIDAPIKEYGLIENGEPSIQAAIDKSVKQGGDEMIIIPALLFPGIHANEDIPLEITKAKKQYPSVHFRYGSPIGADQKLVDIFVERLKSAQFSDEEKNGVLLVSHGSRNRLAQTAFEKLASLLQNRLNAAVYFGFIKADPFYLSLLESIHKHHQQIFLVPHLLFIGEYQKRMLEHGSSSVKVCEPTSFDENLKAILLQRVIEAKNQPVQEWC